LYVVGHGTAKAARNLKVPKDWLLKLVRRHANPLRSAIARERTRCSKTTAQQQVELQMKRARVPRSVLDPTTVRAPSGDRTWASLRRVRT
jgi:hypothetical protein